ncbi:MULTISPECIES: electron transfer flavoprotein subunit alpha/FixB family protein [Megasphaera]|uniref:Electron transfer flavoprotein domain protein n=1 Tax=Megasphaera vaginalis (ex Srinivasan et al. 2021) TaxID=1111454 RepID=U7USN3_9FIRM|nr:MULTISPECIES: electron transfer flavoprotein subunit alpha/FixB family protein [Megasphaera]ERT61904.1 electron transfer flavoprotein domain protein [Megasphaera vaginalis (ex Srinivasan et al. 2021)]
MELKQNVWVYIELVNGTISPLSLELLGKGRELADSKKNGLVGWIMGEGAAAAAEQVIGYGADAVVVVDNPELASFESSLYTKAAEEVLNKYEPNVVLIGASHNGRDLGGRLSAAMNLGLVADCINCGYEGDDDSITWIRPAFTGKLFVKILTTTRPQLATISDKIFRGNVFDAGRTGEIIHETVSLNGAKPLQQVVGFEPLSAEEQELTITNAEIVVGAGRGVGSPEGLQKVADFAASIGAALGVSKPLVDSGWAPHEKQVGITGSKIAPKIYIALGISGAIQHKLGLQDAELIIAVNSDPDAPIFEFAHYGIVGDLFDALPVLEEEIKKIK